LDIRLISVPRFEHIEFVKTYIYRIIGESTSYVIGQGALQVMVNKPEFNDEKIPPQLMSFGGKI
jgi:hypothetical protein